MTKLVLRGALGSIDNRGSREAVLRNALFASTALVAITLASPVAAQSAKGGDGGREYNQAATATRPAGGSSSVPGSDADFYENSNVGANGAGGGGANAAGGNARNQNGVAVGTGGAAGGMSGGAGGQGQQIASLPGKFDAGGGGGGGDGATIVTNGAVGAVLTGGAGGAGAAGTNAAGGGGGGAGGAGLRLVTGTTFTVNAGVTGGAGGAGGGSDNAGGGGGGGGGYGITATGASAITVNSAVTGGNGANGGNVTNDFRDVSTAGDGGAGGVGIYASGRIVNTSGITGGSGGTKGTGGINGSPDAVAGAGGAGVMGANLAITNIGTITGGMSSAGGTGAVQSDAITFTGGANALTLSAVSNGGVFSGKGTQGSINGAIGVAGTLSLDGGPGTLATAETASSTATLANVIHDSPIGAGAVIKSGVGTLTVSGGNTYTGGTTFAAGTLNVGSTGALGTTGALNFTGGTLQYSTANTTDYSARFATTDNNAVSIDTNGQNVQFNSVIASNGGSLTKLGTGTLTLNADETYTGATTIAAGTLAVLGRGFSYTSNGTKYALDVYTLQNSSSVALTGATSVLAFSNANGLNAGNVYINNLSGVAGSSITLDGQYGYGQLNVEQNTATTFGGTITGTNATNGNIYLFVYGDTQTGSLTLTAANTAVNYVEISQNPSPVTLALTGAGSLTNAAVYVDEGGTFDVSGITGNATTVRSLGSNSAYTDANPAGIVNLGATTLTISDGQSTVSGIIQGAGGITVAGGTEYFEGINTYSGATVINQNAALYVQTGSSYDNNGEYTPVNGSIASSSSVQVDGTLSIEQQNQHNANSGSAADPTQPATAISNLTGGTTGQVLLGQNALSITNANGTFAGVISDQVGMATFDASGNYTGKSYTSAGAGVRIAGTLTLSGDSTYTGATTVDGAAVTLGAGGTTGSVAGPIVFAGTDTSRNTLTVDHSNTVTIAQAISGAGSVVQAGTGTTALNAAETYTGTTTISAGTLTLGTTGSIAASTGVIDNATFDISGHTGDASITTLSGSTAGLVTLGANTLTLTNAADTFAGAIAGTGGLTLTAGKEILSGTNSVAAGQFTGVVNVNGGTLSVNGTFGDTAANTAQVNVNAGGTLHGSGTIDGSVAVTNGGTVSAGNSPGTLTVAGNYTLGMGSTSLFELGTPGVAGGMTNDLINVGGNLTLGGTLSLVNSADATMAPVSGDYRLFNYGGTLSGQFASITSPPTDYAFTVTTGVPGQVNLSVAAAGQAIQYFDGTDTTGATAGVQGGTGVWNTANTNWTNRTGTTNAAWRSGVGIFTTTGGTVTVAGAQSFQGLQFSADGYRLGGTGTLIVTGDPYSTAQQSFVNVDAGVGATIANVITGAAGIGLIKLGTGTLTLSGANTYTGATTVSAGTLALGATNAIGAGSALTVAAGATLDLATYNDTVANAALNGTLNGSGTLTAATYMLNGATVNGNLGAGTLTQAGGTSTLNGTSAAATVAINSGTLATGSAERIADNAAVTIASGAQLSLGGAETIGSLAGAGNVALGAYTLTTGGLNASPTFSGVASGTGGLTKVGNGTLTLSGANTYTGATTISAGTLALSGGAAIADTSAVAIASGATLLLNASETIGSLSGAGNVTLGANTLTTGGANASPTFSGVASGTGGLTKVGTGALTLSGANTYTGATTVSAGTLALGATNTIGAGSALTVAAGATLDLAAYNDTVASSALNGTLNGSGTLTAATYMLNGATVNGNLGAGTLTQAGGTSTLNGTSAAATVAINGGILATGAAERIADNAAVTIASGAQLSLGGAETIGSLAGAGNVALGVNTLTTGGLNASPTFSGVIAGSGGLTKVGTGTLTLSGANTYTGATTVAAGTLALGASNVIADVSAVGVATAATLNLGANSDTVASLTLAGTLAGTGTLTAATYTLNGGTVNANLGAGTLTQASGASTLNGTAGTASVNVSGGTLSLGANDRLADNAALNVASGATLNMGAFTDTVGTAALAGTLAGTGTLTAAAYTLNGGTVNANLGAGTLNQASGASTLNGTAGAASVNVSGGTLSLGANDRLADNAALRVASGATLNMGAFTDTVGTAALAGTLAGTGTLTAATYTLNGATVAANLGAGTLTQAGGTSLLSGTAAANTVNVNAGTLALGASNRLADAATVMVASGAILDLGANSDTVRLVGIAGTLAGSGTLSAGEYDLSGANVNANLGTGNLFQQAGTSTLNGTAGAANVVVNAGTLVLGASNRLADTAAVAVATGATLNLGANSDTVGTLALNGTLSGTGTLTASTYTLNNAAVNANLGTGTLVQAGGTSVLSGMAATGTVAVMAGTLRLGASDRIADTAMLGVASGATFDLAGYNETVGTLAGSGTLALGAGTLSAGGTNADYAFGGNVTGTGDLTKVGTGTFSLIGNEGVTGRLNVNAGTLMLAGTTAGSVRVQGGTLTGASAIAGNLLLSSGTLSPGIATQPVAAIQAGSLTVTGGTTVFDFGGMASGFTADLLKVTGAATLTGGTVTTRGLDGSANYKMEQTYTVLTSGALTGTYASGSTFTQVSNNSDLYYRLRYDLVANGVVLEVRKPVDFTTTLGTGATGNQLAIAGALNGGVLTGSDAFVTALNAISQLTPDQRRSTLDTIGGESIADISTSVALVGNRFNELLRQRIAVGAAGNSADPSLIAGIAGGKRGLDQVRASGQVGAEGSSFADGHANDHAGAWVQTFGGAGTLDGLNGTASIKDQSYGVAAGIDAKVAGLSIGGAFAASALDTRVEGRNATNRGTLYQGGGYVAYDNGQAYASAVGSYFSGDVTSTRQVYIGAALQGAATGTPKVTGYTAGGAAGYRLPIGGGVRFTPQVSFQATHVDRDAFTETGAGVLSLSAAKDVRNLYTATAEGRLSYLSAAPGGIIEPYAGAGVAFNFGDLDTLAANRFTGAPTGTGAFAISGARLSPTTALISGGIEGHPNDRVTLGMGVETRLSNRERDGRVELHVRLGF